MYKVTWRQYSKRTPREKTTKKPELDFEQALAERRQSAAYAIERKQ